MFVADYFDKEIEINLHGIMEAMLEAYANGDSEAVIFVHSAEAIALVEKWTKIWNENNGKCEIWKDANGDGVPAQAILQMIVGFKRSMPIVLKEIQGQKNNPLYCLQFHATEIFE